MLSPTLSDWLKLLKPLKNPLDSKAPFQGTMFWDFGVNAQTYQKLYFELKDDFRNPFANHAYSLVQGEKNQLIVSGHYQSEVIGRFLSLEILPIEEDLFVTLTKEEEITTKELIKHKKQWLQIETEMHRREGFAKKLTEELLTEEKARSGFKSPQKEQ